MKLLGAVVVGAGQAGIAVSHHLAQRGIDHLVLERGRIGETWRSQRWDSFALNTPGWLNRLPGDTEPVPEPDGFATHTAFAGRLATYAERHGLPVRTDTTVERVTADRTVDGVFVVSVADTGATRVTEPIRTRTVIAASGALNVPRVPPVAAGLPTGILQLSAAEYRNVDGLPPGAAIVVGSAQSGVQIAEDLIAAGRTVYLCTSAVGRVRRRYRGRDSFAWLEAAGFWAMTIATLPDPAMQRWPNPVTSGVGPLGHSVSLQWLADRGVVLLGRPQSVAGARMALDDSVGANVAFGDRSSMTIRGLMDRGIAATGERADPIEADPADEPHPDPASIRAPAELDLRRAGVRSVIWTTGFTGDFSYLPLAALDSAGSPVHDLGTGALPGLYHVGYPWLRTRRSGIIAGVDADGAMIADQVAARLAGRAPAPAAER